MVVRRPADPKMFNGTVLVEWYNVTNGFDAENVWFFDWEHILGEGYIWVGVSAQQVGINALLAFNSSRYPPASMRPWAARSRATRSLTTSFRKPARRSGIRLASIRLADSSRK
jgi:hypothetical protein